MQELLLIQDIVVILLVSLPIIFLFKKINLPSIVGFLIAGMLIGPYGFKLIRSVEQIEVMAEVGIILLLFTIGLELSFTQMLKMKKYVFIVGSLQVGLTILFAFIAFIIIGFTPQQSAFFGMLISISSTSIILTLLSQRNELDAPHGKIAVSVSIFQDLAVVPMVLLLPLLSATEKSSAQTIIIQLLVAFGSVVFVFIAAKFLMPKIIFQLAKLRMRDAFTIGIIMLLLGTAYVTHLFGLSFAIGAFIAGLILSESEYSYQIVSDILPLKDAFNSIFFVSIGLLLNIQFVIQFPLIILLITVSVIAVKIITVLILVMLIKYPIRVALLSALILAQIGEFAFVLAQEGAALNLISGDYYNAFLASSIFTIILTPLLFKFSPYLSIKSSQFGSTKTQSVTEIEKLAGHVIIAGFGLNGSNLARVLKETGIKYIVIELNPDTVKRFKEKGEKIIYGDVSKEEILNIAQIQKANVIVFAISDPLITKMGLKLAKKLNPHIHTLVRTRYVNEVEDLKKMGADEVIPEEFETALQIFRKVLERYHIPLNVIMKQVTLLREESYSLLRKEGMDISSFIHLDEILAQGLTESYYVNDDNKYIGKSFAEINLRAQSDATVIAIVRNGQTISNPSGKEIIKANDTLVIYGTHQSVDKAIEILNNEEE
jgi:CPA2 family monovalent cation:H+ antiporter-2